MGDGSDFEICHEPFEIDSGLLRSCHEPVPAHVVEPIRVELARHDGRIDRALTASADDVGHVAGKSASQGTQLVGDLAVANERIAHVFMVGHFEAQSLADAFERVTEGAVPEIVNEARRQRLRCLRLFGRMHVTANHLHQSASGMEYAEAVRKPRMRSSGA